MDTLLLNSSTSPLLKAVGSGILAGIHNGSQLLQLQLTPLHAPRQNAVQLVLEIMPAPPTATSGQRTYRVWNSQAWAPAVEAVATPTPILVAEKRQSAPSPSQQQPPPP